MSKNHISLFVLMAILLCFAINPVSATAINETRSYFDQSSVSSDQTLTTFSQGASLNKEFFINYDQIGNAPGQYLYYGFVGGYNIATSGSYTLADSEGTIATGTFQVQPGNYTGLGNVYLLMNFDTWSPGTRTGIRPVPVPTELNITDNWGNQTVVGFFADQAPPVGNNGNIMLAGRPSGNPLQHDALLGTHNYVGYNTAQVTMVMSNLTPIANGMIVRTNIFKAAGLTRSRIYTNDTLIYDGGVGNTNEFNILTTGANLTFESNVPASGSTYHFRNLYPLTETPVTPTNTTVTKTVFIKDSVSNSLIAGSQLDMFNNYISTWTNQTSPSGAFSYTANLSDVISPYASATGYKSAGYFDLLWTSDTSPITITLDRTNTSTDINSTVLNVHVFDATDNAPLSNVFVYPANTTYPPAGQVEYTNAAGLATLYLRNGTYYSVTASQKTGYIDQTVFVTTNANTQSLNILMQRITSPPTPTYTVPTTSPTGVIPTTGTGGNYTGFWGPIANGLQGAGALPSEIGILLTAMLIFVGFCVGGWSGRAYDPAAMFNAPGSVVGGVFGFVLSVAFGFIPLVYVIGLVLLCAFGWLFLSRMG